MKKTSIALSFLMVLSGAIAPVEAKRKHRKHNKKNNVDSSVNSSTSLTASESSSGGTDNSAGIDEINDQIHELVKKENAARAKLNGGDLWGKPEGVEAQQEYDDATYEKSKLLRELKKLQDAEKETS